MNIIVRDKIMLFLCKLFYCERNFLQYFRPVQVVNDNPVIVDGLADPEPLFPIGRSNTFLFVLKYN